MENVDIGAIVSLVSQVAIILLTALSPVLALWLKKTLGLEVKAQAIDTVITQGVGYAEQEVRRRLKVGSPPPTPDEKLAIAKNYVALEARQRNLDVPSEGSLSRRIEAEVGKMKSGREEKS